MTDEEKAEEYAKINCGTHPIQEDLRECAKYSYLAGLAEGRKEVREHETTCVNRLHQVEKENAELKAQIEKMCCKNIYLVSDKNSNAVPCYTIYNCRNCHRKEPAE